MFGATSSDHMLEIDWTAKGGWSAPTITPYHNLSLDPAAACLHYAVEAFEGMNVYLDAAGKPRLFRPDLNMTRLSRSLTRLAGPELDKAGFLSLLKSFAVAESGWIPRGDGFSLYLRPTVISTWGYLGVSPSKSFKLFVIACPVGPYYPDGFKPVKLLAETSAVRAWPGGVGHAKLGANYAPTIAVQMAAAAAGYAQVLWLFGPDHAVTEVGTMNFFVVWKTPAGKVQLVTAPLTDGTILPGVTRQSILDLARAWGEFEVVERKFTMPEVVAAAKEGRLLEAFGAGTAAVVSPVKAISYEGKEIAVPVGEGGAGPLTARFWSTLLDVQYGRVPGPDPSWSVVCE